MDIRIDSEEGNFKFRVCGILEYNNKYLIVKMNKNKFYCLPGGHVELGEDTDHAVLREMEEELGFPVKNQRLIAIIQNFFKQDNGKIFHEIGFYYIVNAIEESRVNTKDYVRDEMDKGKIQHLVFKWVTKEELKQIDFRPKLVVDCLQNSQPKVLTTRD